eukprot:CAMPEP_0114315728 /NCGR_PEP_ID=MMETSP0059-20121206/22740_1 /TAXON_ID=36894 /ORGANISM="Pyramimonas parkeae, Strain CCMP726" /LENGTH=111 /DNA_ID=CAMNT_0001441443 /DNA_START=142 /DNA_END=474 /DNA_ORIENTATION=-
MHVQLFSIATLLTPSPEPSQVRWMRSSVEELDEVGGVLVRRAVQHLQYRPKVWTPAVMQRMGKLESRAVKLIDEQQSSNQDRVSNASTASSQRQSGMQSPRPMHPGRFKLA